MTDKPYVTGIASPVTGLAGGTSAVGFSLLMFIVIGVLFIVILLAADAGLPLR